VRVTRGREAGPTPTDPCEGHARTRPFELIGPTPLTPDAEPASTSRPRLCTPEWTLFGLFQCAGGHHGAGLNWRRRCDDLLAVPRGDRAVGPETGVCLAPKAGCRMMCPALGWKTAQPRGARATVS